MDITNTGPITPHTVKLDTRPVILAPPKLRTVANHNVAIVHIAVVKGDKFASKNVAPYPTAEIAIATLAIKSDTPYV